MSYEVYFIIKVTEISAEEYQAMLKKEEVNLATYYDFDVARLAIFEYIESWYNRKRLHSSIGYMTPQQLEDSLRKIA